jgi:hypothetical protein
MRFLVGLLTLVAMRTATAPAQQTLRNGDAKPATLEGARRASYAAQAKQPPDRRGGRR